MAFWEKQFWKGFFRKESQTAKLITSSGRGGVIWPERGYDNFAKETYLKNITAFKAIDEVAKSTASVPWKQFRRLKDGKREPEEKEQLGPVLKRPNSNESWPWVILRITAFLVMSGNAILEKVGPDTGPNKGQPKEMYALRPDRFRIKNNERGQISQYIYEVNGQKTTWDVDPVTGKSNVLHLKTFHPLDDWWGAAPTESAAREIDTSNAATEWNKNLLDNQGRPGMVYTLVGSVSEDQMNKLERFLRESHAGPQNAGKDLILTGERGTGVQPYGWSPTEMDFGEGEIRLMRKIAMAYGVPPELLGIESSTFNNRSEARLFFWENTVNWWLNYIREEVNNWIYGPDSDLFIDYILDDVPAFVEKRNLIWDRAEKSNFLSMNEKREMVGKESWGPAGDVILVDASKIPLTMLVEGAGQEEGKEEETRKHLLDQGYDEDEINKFIDSDYEDLEESDEDIESCEIINDYNPEEGKPYENEHACRLEDPGQFDKFSRINCFRRSSKKCVDYIFGIKDGKSKVQAMRYKKGVWTADDARTHCVAHDGKFEAAKKSDE